MPIVVEAELQKSTDQATTAKIAAMNTPWTVVAATLAIGLVVLLVCRGGGPQGAGRGCRASPVRQPATVRVPMPQVPMLEQVSADA
jgi:hypothetical protein